MFSAIEALRFMGAIMVVLFHLNAYPSGYKGVDLFFVISGFVLYYRYLRSGSRQEPRSYYFVHRISKIYLLYWTALLLALLLAPPIVWSGFWKTFLLFPGHHETLSVSWSLSYELYFYALFSVFLFLRAPVHRHALLFSLLTLTSVITAAALLGSAIGGTAFRGSALNFMLGHNTWEFVLGLLAGYLFEKRTLPTIKWMILLLAAILGLFCYLNLSFTDPRNPVVYGILSFGLVFLSAGLNRRFPFSFRILTLLGLSTYAIYLFHLILIPPLQKIHLASPALFIPLITLIGVLIYKFYEAPLLKAIRKSLS